MLVAWLLWVCAAPVRDESGGALVPDTERTGKCCLCPTSNAASAQRCGLVKPEGLRN